MTEIVNSSLLVVPVADGPCEARKTPGNYHFEGRCDHCDAYVHQAHLTLGEVEDRYNTGRISQVQYEAYRHVFELLSPYHGTPERPWDPKVRAFARRLLQARNFTVPQALGEPVDEDDSCGASLTARCFNGTRGCRVHPVYKAAAR